MKLDVYFSPAGLSAAEVAGRPIFVIDVLRASTVICAALHHGAPPHASLVGFFPTSFPMDFTRDEKVYVSHGGSMR